MHNGIADQRNGPVAEWSLSTGGLEPLRTRFREGKRRKAPEDSPLTVQVESPADQNRQFTTSAERTSPGSGLHLIARSRGTSVRRLLGFALPDDIAFPCCNLDFRQSPAQGSRESGGDLPGGGLLRGLEHPGRNPPRRERCDAPAEEFRHALTCDAKAGTMQSEVIVAARIALHLY